VTRAQSIAFRRLGRIEVHAGRTHDALQAAYRIAAERAVLRLVRRAEWTATPPARVAQLSAAVFAVVDRVAALSAEGFAAEMAQRGGLSRSRAELLRLLVGRDGYAPRELSARARAAAWTPPVHAALVELVSTPHSGDAELMGVARRLFGPTALAGRVAGRSLVVLSGGVGREQIYEVPIGRGWLVVGPTVPLADLGSTARLVFQIRDRRMGSAGPQIVFCEDHLLELLCELTPDVLSAMARRRLGPIEALTPAKRLKYGQLLSAVLEFGSVHGAAPGVLDKHRQTLRYQLDRLEQLLGDQLRDRSTRVELLLALRLRLPVWEREAADAQRRAERATRA
jgi:hypothetical protein